MAPKVGSKRKEKELICDDSPPQFDHLSYPSVEAFKRCFPQTITFGRVVNFSHLDFISFNQLMRRIGWLTFAR